jgi:hypothetical protein
VDGADQALVVPWRTTRRLRSCTRSSYSCFAGLLSTQAWFCRFILKRNPFPESRVHLLCSPRWLP